MRDLVSTVAANVRETLKAALHAEKRGRVHLAQALRVEASEMAEKYHLNLTELNPQTEKDWRRKRWERKKAGKAKFWRDRG